MIFWIAHNRSDAVVASSDAASRMLSAGLSTPLTMLIAVVSERHGNKGEILRVDFGRKMASVSCCSVLWYVNTRLLLKGTGSAHQPPLFLAAAHRDAVPAD